LRFICQEQEMSQEPAEAVWYCVVVRDALTKRFQHYRCLWNRPDAESYKLQLEQASDRPEKGSSSVAIEVLPAGELPKRIG
jgi:hypothetical protein